MESLKGHLWCHLHSLCGCVAYSEVCVFTSAGQTSRASSWWWVLFKTQELSHWTQSFLSPKVHTDHLGILKKCRFCLGRSGVRPESLHFSKFSVDAETADCRTSLLSCLHWGHQAIKRILEKKKEGYWQSLASWYILLLIFKFLSVAKDDFFNIAFDVQITKRLIHGWVSFCFFV